jgi:hypothetical protein
MLPLYGKGDFCGNFILRRERYETYPAGHISFMEGDIGRTDNTCETIANTNSLSRNTIKLIASTKTLTGKANATTANTNSLSRNTIELIVNTKTTIHKANATICNRIQLTDKVNSAIWNTNKTIANTKTKTDNI